MLDAIDSGALGRGSVAGDEYFRNMEQARLCDDGTTRWVEVCYCYEPLDEERPYWEQYFEFTRIQDAHDRRNCRDRNGSEPWACSDCDCTMRLEQKLATTGESFLEALRAIAQSASAADASSAYKVRSSDPPATRPHPSAG